MSLHLMFFNHSSRTPLAHCHNLVLFKLCKQFGQSANQSWFIPKLSRRRLISTLTHVNRFGSVGTCFARQHGIRSICIPTYTRNCRSSPLGTALPLYRTDISLLSRERFFIYLIKNIFHYLIFAWPYIIDINNIDNQLDATITAY